MLISNCIFFLTFTPTITPIVGLKCLVLKALYHCAISFFITLIFLKKRRFGQIILAKFEPHHAYSCHAYKKKNMQLCLPFLSNKTNLHLTVQKPDAEKMLLRQPTEEAKDWKEEVFNIMEYPAYNARSAFIARISFMIILFGEDGYFLLLTFSTKYISLSTLQPLYEVGWELILKKVLLSIVSFSGEQN